MKRFLRHWKARFQRRARGALGALLDVVVGMLAQGVGIAQDAAQKCLVEGEVVDPGFEVDLDGPSGLCHPEGRGEAGNRRCSGRTERARPRASRRGKVPTRRQL